MMLKEPVRSNKHTTLLKQNGFNKAAKYIEELARAELIMSKLALPDVVRVGRHALTGELYPRFASNRVMRILLEQHEGPKIVKASSDKRSSAAAAILDGEKAEGDTRLDSARVTPSQNRKRFHARRHQSLLEL